MRYNPGTEQDCPSSAGAGKGLDMAGQVESRQVNARQWGRARAGRAALAIGAAAALLAAFPLAVAGQGSVAAAATAIEGTSATSNSAGTFSFSATSYSVSEAAALATIRVTRANGKAAGATVDYAVTPGTATLGSDYNLPAASTLTFAANQLSATFTIPIVKDTIHERNETVLLNLSNPQPVAQNAALGTPSTAVLTIVDNDAGGKVQFMPAAYVVNAAAGPTSAKLTVKRTLGLASGVTVHCTMANGTATGGVDFDNAAQDLTFLSSGLGATTQILTIPISQDTGGAKDFTVTLNPPSGGAVLGTPTVATVKILGTEPTLGFGTGAYTVKTTQPTALITVKRTAPMTGTVKVNYATSPGPGTDSSDYTDVSGTLTFAPNVSTRTFGVPIIKDPLVDLAETVNLTLSSPTWSLGTAVLDPVLGTSVLTIINPNKTPSVQFSAATYTVNEATPKALISVKRTGDLFGTVTVDYAATGGSATNGPAANGGDYTLTPGTLTFLPNQVTRTLSIPIVNDTARRGHGDGRCSSSPTPPGRYPGASPWSDSRRRRRSASSTTSPRSSSEPRNTARAKGRRPS